MKNISAPRIYQIAGSEKALSKFQKEMEGEKKSIKEMMLEYPTVYIHTCKVGKNYEVYVGETADIIRRTTEHIQTSGKDMKSWQNKFKKRKSSLLIIGHEHFNKSLTLDIENQLILYISGMDTVKKIHNRRGNEQKRYYTSDEREDIFQKIWEKLCRQNRELFLPEQMIVSSAQFKASLLHTLTEEQHRAKDKILEKVYRAVKSNKKGQLIFLAGETGTGKTVLNSSLFYELTLLEDRSGEKQLRCYLLVNHGEQLKVYRNMAEKLNLNRKHENVVCNPTHFINTHTEDDPVDVIFVDEAHLLWTQGKQAYQGNNQLEDIRKRAKIVIVMFDRKQILKTEQYWESQILEQLVREAKKQDNYIELKEQLRINADKETVQWIRKLIDKGEIDRIPRDSKGYQLEIYDTPGQMKKDITKKAKNKKASLSRMLATFDWDYVDKRRPQLEQYWKVKIGKWSMPWNRQLDVQKNEKDEVRKRAWAEQHHTINEVGSTYTIQGFDLNYAGVILGPSVKYEHGKVVFHPECSKNKNAIRNRTLDNGSQENFAETLLRNEVNVLLTRGVDGLFIYAVDDKLRQALKEAKCSARSKNATVRK